MLGPLKLLSMGACILILIGYFNRSRKRVHISMMVSALVIDLGIVLYLEIARAVIESIPSKEMTPLLFVHILISITVLVLYGIQLYTGIKKARGQSSAIHSKIPFWFLVTRFGNLLTSFLIMTD